MAAEPMLFIYILRSIRLVLLLALASTLVGCGGGRLVTIRTVPPDASIIVDGQPRPRGPITERFSFGGGQFHTVLVTRVGYTDKTILLDGSSDQTEVTVQLKPRTRRVRFITPLPAIVKVDGTPVSPEPVTQASKELEFTVDANNNWIPHVVSAERGGFRRAERVIRFTDADPVYNLVLEPERKTVTIKTEPPGAEVIVDGTSFGPSPVTLQDLVIATDPQTNAWIGRSVRAIKPGFEPAVGEISWDDGKTEYQLTLGARSKTVRVKVDPADATVKLDGKVLPHKPDGVVETRLDFAPLTGAGEMPVYELSVSGPADKFEPATVKVGWDEGRSDYSVALSPIPGKPMPEVPPVASATRPAIPPPASSMTRPVVEVPQPTPPTNNPPPVAVKDPPKDPAKDPVKDPKPAVGKSLPLLMAAFRHEKNAWLAEARVKQVPAPSSRAEPDGRKPTLVTKAHAGTTPDGIVTSPDGSFLAWTALQQPGADKALHSQLVAVGTSGSKPALELTDGKSLDLMPSFSPDGQRLLFSSDRLSDGRFGCYETFVAPQASAVRAAGDTPDTELWPTLDSSPRPRLYIEARPANGGASKLVAIDTIGGKRIDLGQTGQQPRVSPRADALIFVRPDATTGKRDIWLLKLGEDAPVNLTNSPNDDDFDPSWSKTGSRIAFASDRAGGAKAASPDINLWVLRVGRPTDVVQVTDNDAYDDNPAWSGDDTSLYFRSSRGGEWGIWRIDLPAAK